MSSEQDTIDSIINDIVALASRLDGVIGMKPPYARQHLRLWCARNRLWIARNDLRRHLQDIKEIGDDHRIVFNVAGRKVDGGSKER
jgi:hypothetical protein